MLELHNLYTQERFNLRQNQLKNLEALEERILSQQNEVLEEHHQVQTAKNLTFEEVMDGEKSVFAKTKDSSKEKLKESIESLEQSMGSKSTKSSP